MKDIVILMAVEVNLARDGLWTSRRHGGIICRQGGEPTIYCIHDIGALLRSALTEDEVTVLVKNLSSSSVEKTNNTATFAVQPEKL